MTDKANILEVQQTTVSFDGFKALDDLSFSMRRGELRFLIGPNGAGKTTLLDTITGKTRPRSGRVLFDGGVDVVRWSEHRRVRHGIARKFQTPTIFPSLTVYENLEAAIGMKESVPTLFRPLPKNRRDRIQETLALINLTSLVGARAGTLAHGQKQWLEIGMLVIQDPQLLLLDEPVAGMTRRDRDRTGDLVQQISKEHSVLVVEHDMEFVRRYASTVTVLHLGKLLCEGPVQTVQDDPRVIEVYLGRKHSDAAS
ncbi:MAG TPA: urea ABC transporter ATP-binding protein UrtD [Armatimonadota bacterium]|nr:urea ABC transporter ATP-binding protein UrtD [Armatimonadota bacterium]